MGFIGWIVTIFVVIVLVVTAVTSPVETFKFGGAMLKSGKIVVEGGYKVVKGLYVGFVGKANNQTGG